YIYPQRREWGAWLYEACVRKLGWSNPKARINTFIPDPRTTSIALLMAHELDLAIGDHALVVRTGYHGRGANVPQEPAKHVVSTPAAPNPAAIAVAASSWSLLLGAEELQDLGHELLVVLEDAAMPGVGIEREPGIGQAASQVGGVA